MRFMPLLLLSILAGSSQASVTPTEPGESLLFPGATRIRYELPPSALDATGRVKAKGVQNALCKKATLDRVEFFGVEGIANDTNYCEVDPKEIPADVTAAITKMGELNSRVASALGTNKEKLFPMTMNVFFTAYETGALGGSQVTGVGVTLAVLPTWKFAQFSTMQYAHEIVHVLSFNPGPFATLLTGLVDHPFLAEALPDLVAAVVHDSPKIVIEDPDLPECIRVFRDGTPSQSLDQPFAHFYPMGSVDEILACCEKTKDLSNSARRICRGYAGNRAKGLAKIANKKVLEDLNFRDYFPENLAAPFEAENCRVDSPSGLTFLDNCDTHQFAPTLVSFFFRLKELTGKSQFLSFMNQVAAGALKTESYDCGYASASRALGGARATVKMRPLLGAFINLRESLSSDDQARFDLAWKEHGMAKFVDLDRLYRTESFAGYAQTLVGLRNELFTPMFGCDNLYNFDRVRCEVTCRKVDGLSLDSPQK